MRRLITIIAVIHALTFSLLPQAPAASAKLDVVFGLDLTGSMGDELASVKANAISIMNQIATLVPDSAFGVVSIVD